jgi:aspartyl-tRNA(Asn)/glutamyl-tRNA(Gln) amidotransferase subunit C
MIACSNHFTKTRVFSMPIDQKTIAKIALLARLKIPDEEQRQVAGELSKILDWVAQLDEVDIAGIEPLANVNDEALRWRADSVTDGGAAADILANAPAKTAGFFTVPKVIE